MLSIGLLPALVIGWLGYQMAELWVNPIHALYGSPGVRDPLALAAELQLFVPAEVAIGSSCALLTLLLVAAWRWLDRYLSRPLPNN